MRNTKMSFVVELDPEEWADEIYDSAEHDGQPPSFADFVAHQVRKASIKAMEAAQVERIQEEVRKAFDETLAPAVNAAIEEKLEAFMKEDIALTDRWGKATFIGSIDDLLKRTFDDRLLHPVDSSGKRLNGCTSETQTYVQWLLKSKADAALEREIKSAQDQTQKFVSDTLKKAIETIKQDAAARAIAALDISLK